MKPVLINGLGCLQSGARIILNELVRAFPADRSAILIIPTCNRQDVLDVGSNIRIIALNHQLFGRWLRPIFEAVIFVLGWSGVFSRIVNLSHYGWCPGRRYTLYFHNQLLIEHDSEIWSGAGGKPNRFKLWCLYGCLRRADRIVVQTTHTADKLREFAQLKGIVPRSVEVVSPFPEFPQTVIKTARRYKIQFIYPSSPFPHKRPELAARAIIEANRTDSRIGLVLTVDPMPGLVEPCITYLGPISRDEVLAHYAVSDALLFTSGYETLGLPLLEAIHFGLPAVLPEKNYARAIYADAATYYEKDGVADVAEALLTCIREKSMLTERLIPQRSNLWKERSSWAAHWERFGVTTER